MTLPITSNSSGTFLRNPPLPVAMWYVTFKFCASLLQGNGMEKVQNAILHQNSTIFTRTHANDKLTYANISMRIRKTVYISVTPTKKPSLQKFRLCFNEHSSGEKKIFHKKAGKGEKNGTANANKWTKSTEIITIIIMINEMNVPSMSVECGSVYESNE